MTKKLLHASEALLEPVKARLDVSIQAVNFSWRNRDVMGQAFNLDSDVLDHCNTLVPDLYNDPWIDGREECKTDLG